MKNNILLVGGSGYLGQHLAAKLKNEYNVVVSGLDVNCDNCHIKLDFSDPQSFSNITNKFDYVFILAASINGIGSICLNNIDLSVNTIGLASFLQYLLDNDITKKIVYTSSMTVYSKYASIPVKETADLSPVNIYGLSKKIAEDIITFSSRENQISSLILRLPGIYGGSRKGGYIYNTLKKALNNEDIILDTKGLIFWECMNIDDICGIIVAILKSYQWDNQIINVGYGELIDFVEVAKKIVAKTNSQSEIKVLTKDYIDFYLDNSRLRKITTIPDSFDSSLSKYIRYCQNELCDR